MQQKQKRSVRYGLVSFVLLYACCLLIGLKEGNQISMLDLTLTYLGWSLPASLIIVVVAHAILPASGSRGA